MSALSTKDNENDQSGHQIRGCMPDGKPWITCAHEDTEAPVPVAWG